MTKLKTYVSILEGQVDSLKVDLTEVRRSQSLISSGHDSPTHSERDRVPPEPSDEQAGECHDSRLSFSYVYKRNKTRDWVPAMSGRNSADGENEAGRETDKLASRTVFRSPERCCRHSCSIAAGNPEKHSLHIRSTHRESKNSCSEGVAVCNGAETTDRLSTETDHSPLSVLNDTLSDLVDSNSDTSGRLFDVKVSTTVRCRKQVEASKASEHSAGPSDVSVRVKWSAVDCSTQTVVDEHGNGRYAV